MFQVSTNERKRENFYRKNLKKSRDLLIPVMRLEKRIPKPSRNSTEDLVLLPSLLTYVLWVLKKARLDQVDTLYFLSRDAYPAYLLADKICKSLYPELNCRYFYCSRYSLKVPMYSEDPEEMLSYICRGGIEVTLRKILYRAGLKDTDLKSMSCFGTEKELDRVLPYSELGEVKSRLGANKEFLALVKERSQGQWELLKDYFIQEGMDREKILGIVDSGWTGGTQVSFEKIRKRIGCNRPVYGYYWGLYEIPEDLNRSYTRTFLFGPKDHLKNKIFFSNCLVETVYNMPSGTTCGYQKEGDRIVPVFFGNNPNEEKLDRFNRKASLYGDLFLKSCGKDILSSFSIESAKKILTDSLHTLFWNPTTEEAERFGTFQFSDDLLDHTTKEVAPVFTVTELRENLLLNKLFNAVGLRRSVIHESAWFPATLKRSTGHGWYYSMDYFLFRLLGYSRLKNKFARRKR